VFNKTPCEVGGKNFDFAHEFSPAGAATRTPKNPQCPHRDQISFENI
jgi:hypothetical protein